MLRQIAASELQHFTNLYEFTIRAGAAGLPLERLILYECIMPLQTSYAASGRMQSYRVTSCLQLINLLNKVDFIFGVVETALMVALIKAQKTKRLLVSRVCHS